MLKVNSLVLVCIEQSIPCHSAPLPCTLSLTLRTRALALASPGLASFPSAPPTFSTARTQKKERPPRPEPRHTQTRLEAANKQEHTQPGFCDNKRRAPQLPPFSLRSHSRYSIDPSAPRSKQYLHHSFFVLSVAIVRGNTNKSSSSFEIIQSKPI